MSKAETSRDLLAIFRFHSPFFRIFFLSSWLVGIESGSRPFGRPRRAHKWRESLIVANGATPSPPGAPVVSAEPPPTFNPSPALCVSRHTVVTKRLTIGMYWKNIMISTYAQFGIFHYKHCADVTLEFHTIEFHTV